MNRLPAIDRPRLHLMPPRAWMNEPHAPIQVNGQHHVFYQHNPVEADWASIGWGHAVSDDLVHWRHLGLALDPREVRIAPDGVWSGSSVLGDDGELYLYFTAGDLSRSPNQAVARARSVDPAITAFHAEDRVLVEQPPRVPGVEGATVFGEFRDPFVWREAGAWFMLVGSGIEHRGGAALLFSSADGLSWQPEPPLLVGSTTDWPATGVMWELPVLLPVGTGPDGLARHVLFVAPWWPEASEHHLQYVWHWIGRWDAVGRRFTPDDHTPRHFDHGGHLTGPSGTRLDDGRSILWTIAQDGRSREEHLETDWAHNAGFPLELSLDGDGLLLVRPVAELARLRSSHLVGLVDPTPAETRAAVAGVEGVQVEILLSVEPASAPFSLLLRRSPSGEQTEIGVDPARDELWVDRSRASHDDRHCAPRRGGPIRGGTERVDLRVIVDGSMIEAYVNDVASVTTRAYPLAPDASGIRLEIPDDARVVCLDIHALAI